MFHVKLCLSRNFLASFHVKRAIENLSLMPSPIRSTEPILCGNAKLTANCVGTVAKLSSGTAEQWQILAWGKRLTSNTSFHATPRLVNSAQGERSFDYHKLRL